MINRFPLTVDRLLKIRRNFSLVLDGELAVPCGPESAIPGSNPHLRFYVF
jgi:hypothetical protein